MSDSATGPLRIPSYRAIWITAMLSNVGSFLQAVAGAWLMKELTDSSGIWVALMVSSNLLPLLFLSLFAGVVADMFSKARVILWSQVLMGASATAMAVTTYLDVVTPGLLLTLGLTLGVGMAFNLPAWQSLVPDLVPRGMVASAVALNSAGFNIARAVGPALGGLILTVWGPAAAFGLNALSYLGLIAVVATLSRTLHRQGDEHASMGLVVNSLALSVRYARYAPTLRRVLTLVALFGVTTAVIQAVLPNRTTQLGGGEAVYGILLGAMGMGALIGAFGRTRSHATRTGRSLPYSIAVFGIAGILTGIVTNVAVAFVCMVIIGSCWILTLTVLNATTQLMTPDWIRGRVMSLYLLAFTGIMPLGSISAGALADRIGAGQAMVVFSSCTLLLGLATPRFRIPPLDRVRIPQYEEERVRFRHPDEEGGPVLVANTWQLTPETLDEFLTLMRRVRLIRLRNGAYAWRLYRNTEHPYRLTEVYLFTSWDEHLAQRQRADDDAIAHFRRARQLDEEHGQLNSHYIAVDLDHPPDWSTLVSHPSDADDHTRDHREPPSGDRATAEHGPPD
ncbi:MAG: MFS transporter [Acidimicrobiia bacterium]|nr:MFS transporter [Acidimicrobiia bacterium]